MSKTYRRELCPLVRLSRSAWGPPGTSSSGTRVLLNEERTCQESLRAQVNPDLSFQAHH